MNKLYKDEFWLTKQYQENKLSGRQIAKVCKCSYGTIFNWMNKYTIPWRTNSESIHFAKLNCCNLTSKGTQFIEGELLGDGHIGTRNNYSAHYAHVSKHKSYVKWLSDQFNIFEIKQSGKIAKGFGGLGDAVYYYKTLSYPELLELHKKWYIPYKGYSKNNRRKWFKIVPRDLKLTPLVCRQWYIGDGSLHHQKSEKSNIVLATMGFRKKDILFLVELLNKKGFEATLRPSDNTIGIPIYSTKQFLDYIKVCPKKIKNIYGYKWDY